MMKDIESRSKSWQLEIKCPNCERWLYGETFLSTKQCVNCGSKFEFKIINHKNIS